MKTNVTDLPIYLDYMATTPLAPEVFEVMRPYWCETALSGNPSSLHAYGQIAHQAIDKAAEQVSSLIQAQPEGIIWTSGATEANNLALKGVCGFYHSQGKHIISIETEHKAVLATLDSLMEQGFEVTYLKPNSQGLISAQQIADVIRPDTILISVMHVNNEIGVIQPLADIGKVAKERGVLFHVDAAQSPGKIEIRCKDWHIDLLSLSAHKFYGPKGIGALYLRQQPNIRLCPQVSGGGQQKGMRSGTLPVPLIVGMGSAAYIAHDRLSEDTVHAKMLFDRLYQRLQSVGDIIINGDCEMRVPHNLNFSVPGVEGESLQFALRDFALSTASACTTATIEPSHVLRAIGLNDELAHSSVRLSTGRLTTLSDIDAFSQILMEQVMRLRQLSGYQGTS